MLCPQLIDTLSNVLDKVLAWSLLGLQHIKDISHFPFRPITEREEEIGKVILVVQYLSFTIHAAKIVKVFKYSNFLGVFLLIKTNYF